MGIVVSGQDRFGQGFVGAFNAFSSARDRKERLEFEEKQQVEIKRRTAVEERRQIARDKLLDPILKQQYELGITKSKQLEQQIQLMDAQTRQLELKGDFQAKEQQQMMQDELTYTNRQANIMQTQKELATLITRLSTSKEASPEDLNQAKQLYASILLNSKQITPEQYQSLLPQEKEKGPGIFERLGNIDPFGLRERVSQFSQESTLGGMGAPAAVASVAAATPVKPGTKAEKSSGEQIRDHYIDVVREWWELEPGDFVSEDRRIDAMHEARLRYMRQVSGGR